MKAFPISLLFCFLFVSLPVFAQDNSGLPRSSAHNIVVSHKLSVDKVAKGSTFQIALILDIAKGWHVNSHRPTTQYLIPTDVQLDPREGYIVTDLKYPKGTLQKLGFSDQPLDVYEGTVTIFVSVKVSETLASDGDTVRGRLRVQSCDDKVCLAPSTISLAIPFALTNAGAITQTVNEVTFRAYKVGEFETDVQPQNELAALFETKGSFVAFLAIFVVGLALNLTPCVYPMLSVTVSLFGTQAETNQVRAFSRAVVYVLGIATMYSILGLTAALGGGLFGSWLQSPWVLGGIGVLMFGLALSSFGLYQIQMPYWLTSKLGGASTTGILGLYFSGLVVGVFAAPCIGPPVIALLTFVGFKGDPWFGFWAFFVLSIGLGFPYLILGTFSGLLKKIPRSGDWLTWVEKVFGVVLTGGALFYFSLAVFPKFAVYVIPLVSVLGGAYLGFLEPSGKTRKVMHELKLAFGIVAIMFGIYTFSRLQEETVAWEPYSEKKLEIARENSQPVIMDFYADWCIPCLELDRKTFVDREVIRTTKEFLRVKVDLTRFDSPESESLRKKYNIAGVPTIVFLRPDGTEELSSRVIGYLPPEEFLTRIKPLVGSN
ncbi:MAG: thiol:disulfide interchange protein DsbD [Bacteroidetes bacterium]|nr:thiol:disulfide interchange protein DsbD [Bacteroidota bacterium]